MRTHKHLEIMHEKARGSSLNFITLVERGCLYPLLTTSWALALSGEALNAEPIWRRSAQHVEFQ